MTGAIAAAAEVPSHRIGPNAVTRIAEAVAAAHGAPAVQRVFRRAGLLARLERPPEGMVDEAEVGALHRALRDELGETAAHLVGREAGRLTGLYLLAHRIPRPAQAVLRRLPAPLAARALLAAVGRHAWTFAGSGRFEAVPGRPLRVVVAGNPIGRALKPSAAPACDYYAGAFECLFRALVAPRAQVIEVRCEACGDAACTFEIRW
jgi:divinyl protochlorophyllide a 8-vinyl-reductase